MTVEDLGKRLLAEIEEVGLDEIMNTLRLQDDSAVAHFGLPQLDALLDCMREACTPSSSIQSTTPVIEITSRDPVGGKTHLLYHLIAVAVLPTHLGGRQGAVVALDTDGCFSVSRLAQQIHKLIIIQVRDSTLDDEQLQQAVLDCLKHVHIFHPQTLATTVATLQSLKTYLFDATRHHSFDRALGFIALDSASAFYWQSRSDAEDAALEASFSSNTATIHNPMGYTQLAVAVKNASRILAAPIIFTTRDLNPPRSTPATGFGPGSQSIRPSLPPPWQTIATLRLIVQRAPVRKLPVEITVEDALRETVIRQQIVDQGRFECFVNEWGVDERTLQKLRGKGMGFDFFVTEDGIKIGDGPE